MAAKLPLVLFLSSLFIHAALAAFVCEDLPNDVCAFSVSSAGKRCLIETMAKNDGSMEYQCRTSEVLVEGLAEYMETDECVNACGVDRKSVGISSDALLEPQFMGKLCSPNCYQKCPNIVELYFNLAAGEGVFLPDLCERQRSNPHRAMIELMSSGEAAPGPVSSEDMHAAPGPVSSEDMHAAPGPVSEVSSPVPSPLPY